MILITGGARVGKTKWAISKCQEEGPNVLYLATSRFSEDFFDKEVVRRSRKQRPFNWAVREAFLGIDVILDEEGVKYDAILIENVRVLVANLMEHYHNEGTDLKVLTRCVIEEMNRVIMAARRINALVVMVTNEVNIHPPDAPSQFKAEMEILGRVNQMLAVASKEVYWMASGIPIKIKPGAV